MNRMICLALLAANALSGCTDASSTDDLAGESPQDGDVGKGDSVAAYTFYIATPDMRVCSLNAHCGGYFVSRANRSTTTCPDGTSKERCYVDSISWIGTGMPSSVAASYEKTLRKSADVSMLLRGSFTHGESALKVNEVWPAGSTTGTTEGVYTLVKNNNTKCIVAPCPSLNEYRLNSSRWAAIADIDYSAVGSDNGFVEFARIATANDGVIVVGDRYTIQTSYKGRTANQFFTRAPVPLH